MRIPFINVFIYPPVKTFYVISLIIVSIIWGATFPLVKLSISYITPLGFIALRFIIGTLILLLFYFRNVKRNMDALKPSLIAGVFLFFGYFFQTLGLKYTTSSHSGFITGLYVVFTPLFSYFIVREKITWRIITSVILSTIGLFFLSGISGFNIGDILTLFCAISYAIQVVLIGKYARRYDSSTIAIFQLLLVSILSTAGWGTERFYMKYSNLLLFGVLFTGIFATALGLLIQAHAQKYVSPSKAAIIFVTEPVFAGIFSYIFLNETLGFMGITGAILILFAMLLVSFEKRV